MSVFYGPALARVKAEHLSPPLARAAPWFASLVGNSGTAFDVGASDGALLQALRLHGINGQGCDISEHMVALAENRRVPVRRGDARSVAVPPSDLVLATGEVLCFRDEAGDAIRSLPRLARAVKPGGALVLDVLGPTMRPGMGWLEDEHGDWLCAFEFRRQGWEITRRMSTFQRAGLDWEREDEVHKMSMVLPGQVEPVLRMAGLKPEPVEDYGGYSIAPGRLAWVARRPA